METRTILIMLLSILCFSGFSTEPNFSDTTLICNINIQTINSQFQNGCLKDQGELLVKIALDHDISPHFFVALIALESGYGTSRLARVKNNFGGIKNSKNTYRGFTTQEEGLNYIADLIKRKYHSNGLISVSSIQKRYAPEWDGNKGWTKKINKLMASLKN